MRGNGVKMIGDEGLLKMIGDTMCREEEQRRV